MNRVFSVVLVAAALAGCETATSLQGAGSGGAVGAVSCDQIYSTFGAYSRDRQSVEALAQIAGYTNTDISNVTPETAASYYENIVTSVNVTLAVQGCTPLDQQ